MNTRERLLEQYPDEDFLFADGFDNCIIGVDTVSRVLVYSVEKCIQKLCIEDGMSREEAEEYFDFNVSCAYVGNMTPVWCEDFE